MTLVIDVQPVPLETHKNGVVRIKGTRVTLDTVISAFLDGDTAEEIVEQYLSLELADVYAILGYYLKNRESVDKYLQKRQKQADKVRQENETHFPQSGLRERLLARQRDA